MCLREFADIDRKLPQLHDARAQKGNESSPAMIVIPLIVVQPPLPNSLKNYVLYTLGGASGHSRRHRLWILEVTASK